MKSKLSLNELIQLQLSNAALGFFLACYLSTSHTTLALSALTLYFTITLNHCIELDNGTSSSLGIRSYITTGMRRALPGLRMEEVLTGGAPRLSP